MFETIFLKGGFMQEHILVPCLDTECSGYTKIELADWGSKSGLLTEISTGHEKEYFCQKCKQKLILSKPITLYF